MLSAPLNVLTEETGAEGRVERQVMVTQLTTAREVVRVILSELGLVSADPNDYYLCIIEGAFDHGALHCH